MMQITCIPYLLIKETLLNFGMLMFCKKTVVASVTIMSLLQLPFFTVITHYIGKLMYAARKKAYDT
jgi:hypothetical protein